MQNVKQNRIDMIDVAKGIGIILVVYAHINLSEPMLTIIYSFHMPLFFILSGFVMNVNKYKTVKDLLKDKFKKMILPYLFFCLLGILSVVVVKLYTCIMSNLIWNDATSFLLESIYSVIWAPYSLKYFTSFNTPMWFIPCLVLTELMYYVICRLFKNKTKWIVAVSLALVVCGWIMEAKISPFDFSVLPFNFSSACFSIGFFAIGNISSEYLKKLFRADINNQTNKQSINLSINLSIYPPCFCFHHAICRYPER